MTSEYEEELSAHPEPVDRRALVEYLEWQIRMIRQQKADPDCESFMRLSHGGTITGYLSIIEKLAEGEFTAESG